MATRGRRVRRFGRGRPFQRRRLSWTNNVFNEAAVNIDGTSTLNVVLDSTDWQGDTSGLQKPAHIKRILFNGQVGIVPNITTDALDIVALFAAVVKMDADDTDTSIVLSSAGSIIQGSRVLWTECWSWGSMEITGGPLQHEYTSGPKLNIDLKPNLTVLPDERVLLILRFGSTVVETISAAAVSGYARCLIEQP